MPSAARNVNFLVAIKDFEMTQAFHGIEVVRADGPIKIGMVDVGESARAVYLVNGFLHNFTTGISFLIADNPCGIDAIHVDDLTLTINGYIAGCFLSRYEQKRFVFKLLALALVIELML